MLRSFLRHYAPFVQKVHLRDLPADPFHYGSFPNLKEVHFEHKFYSELDVPRSAPHMTFNDLARGGSNAQIRDACIAYWSTLQAWFRRYPSWYTLSITGPLARPDFWDLLKAGKGPNRHFDVLFHTEYGPPETPTDRERHKLMKVTSKFADNPFEADGIEIINIERDWELIRRLYDNVYEQAGSYGVRV